ncbi:uncharacterized protein LOC130692548 isoform X1 [Daphnia carinata]|uniref:uncharacterized protein LOC130692548 isoform X1 n=1 Tax=Daphnia carinata TaxID=120202 RepID=UPI00257A1A5E|nr:uncharacterized protein LOC130692548 isoform X1 [Daphnia carinata]
MADTRLPDVVPVKGLATGKEEVLDNVTNEQSCESDSLADRSTMPDWHITVLNQDTSSDNPIVQIWSSNDSNQSDTSLVKLAPEEICSRLGQIEQLTSRSASQLSDSGIDSQLASPTVIDNKLHEQSFVLDLSANHLTVPSRMKLGSLRSSLEKHQPNLKEDKPSIVENSVHGTGEQKSDQSQVNSTSTSSKFLPQKRHHRNFLPVDYSLDGWPRSEHFQKIRSLPSECEQQMEVEETNNSAASWSDSTGTLITTVGRKQKTSSPKICVQKDVYQQPNIDRGFDEHSSMISEHSCSYDSQESSHFLADHELGYSHSRNPSFGSVRSESCIENVDSRSDGSANKPSSHLHSGMLSRSSSRSTFLSVPSKVPNSLWLSSTSDHLHQPDNNKVMERQLSANSHLGSTSSLMASHFSLSNPYLRLCLNEGGINDALLLSLAGDEMNHPAVLDMFGDPYCDAASAVQLSLTQRLAFPQLVENDLEADKQNHRYQQRNELPREESSLNFFAKIITFLVLVFVIVLVVGVLVKISHTPR